MATYIALASPEDPYTTPLFCFSNGRPLTRLRLLKRLHRQLKQAGYQPHWYNTHSFRIGGATSAAEAGVSQATIQQLGRWRSQAYRRYIRPPQKAPALWEPTATAGSTSASRQIQELTAGYIAGGSTNEIHALSRTETQVHVAAHKYTHTLYCISPYTTMLAGYTLGFSSHIKRLFFFVEPEWPLGP